MVMKLKANGDDNAEYTKTWTEMRGEWNESPDQETEMKTQWNGNENWDWMKLIAGIRPEWNAGWLVHFMSCYIILAACN